MLYTHTHSKPLGFECDTAFLKNFVNIFGTMSCCKYKPLSFNFFVLIYNNGFYPSALNVYVGEFGLKTHLATAADNGVAHSLHNAGQLVGPYVRTRFV